MINKHSIFSSFRALLWRTRRYSAIFWLPLILSLVLVVQIHLFNFWLDISLQHYLIRRSVISAAFGLLLFGPAVLVHQRIRYIYLGIVSSLVALLLSIQFIYYSYSGGFLQTSALFYARQGSTTLTTADAFLSCRMIAFIIGPLIVLLVAIFSRRKIRLKKLSLRERTTASVLILAISLFGYAYLFTREYMESGNISSIYQYDKLYDVNTLVSKIGIINFSLGDALTLGLRSDEITSADKSLVKNFSNGRQPITMGNDFGKLKGRNLIIVQVESLENAVIGQTINGQEITPNLNKLRDQGLYYSNYYSPIGPGTTADAEFMTLNSLYSLPNGVAFIEYAQDGYTALPALLKNNNYHTYSFHGDVSSFWNRANIYPQLGYENFFDRKDYAITRKVGAFDLGDKDFFIQSIPKLKSLPHPFMATLITLSSHTPFELPPDLETLNIPATTTLNWLQLHYLQGVHYTDQAIGDFIEGLKSAGLYNNSLILIYGDHGSFTNISSALGIKDDIFPELQTTKVPLIILAPGSSLHGRKSIPGSHLDVYPTVANLLGFKASDSIFGHDLIQEKDAIAISRNLISGTINTIITNHLAYHAAKDQLFEHGQCLELPGKKLLAVELCRAIYEEKSKEVKVSDLMIRADLIKSH